jgi:hypothetical protein
MYRGLIIVNTVIFLLLILGIPELYGQRNDSSYYFYGKVLSLEKGYPVAFAHIINENAGKGVASDSLGNFETWVNPGDILNLSAIGFEHKVYEVPENNPDSVVEIILENKIYAIPEVSISYLGTYKEFKQKVLDLELEDKNKLNPQVEKIFKYVELEYPLVDEPQASILSPISLIYSAFSKEAKAIKKYRKVKERTDVKEKYNVTIIKNLTGLEGIKAKEFMDFCNFTDDYVRSITEYELYSEIKKRYKEYQEDKEDKDNTQ